MVLSYSGVMSDVGQADAQEPSARRWGPVRFVIPEGWKAGEFDNQSPFVSMEPATRDKNRAITPYLSLAVAPKMKRGAHTVANVSAQWARQLEDEGGKQIALQRSSIGQGEIPAMYVRAVVREKHHECFIFQAGAYILMLYADYDPRDERAPRAHRVLGKSIAVGSGTLPQPLER